MNRVKTKHLANIVIIYADNYLRKQKILAGETRHTSVKSKEKELVKINNTIKSTHNRVVEFLSIPIVFSVDLITPNTTLKDTLKSKCVNKEIHLDLRHVPVYVLLSVKNHFDKIGYDKENEYLYLTIMNACLRYHNAISYIPKTK